MIKVAVVDDDEQDRKKLIEMLRCVEKEASVSFEPHEYANGDSFLFDYKPIFQIVFMDIEMPGKDGISIAKELRKMDSLVILVFVTNMAHLAIRGYEVDAIDFVVKPLVKEVFLLKMMRVLGRVKMKPKEHFSIVEDSVTYIIEEEKLLYLEISGHYIIYHTLERDYREYSSFGTAVRKVHGNQFFQCNRGTYVNLSYVKEVSPDSLKIDDKVIPISRSLRKEFVERYLSFLGGK